MNNIRFKINKKDELIKLYKQEMENIANKVSQDAKELAPTDTGTLKDSIKVVINDDKISIQTDCGYGLFQEIDSAFLRKALFRNL
jgi:gas vesicle protein